MDNRIVSKLNLLIKYISFFRKFHFFDYESLLMLSLMAAKPHLFFLCSPLEQKRLISIFEKRLSSISCGRNHFYEKLFIESQAVWRDSGKKFATESDIYEYYNSLDLGTEVPLFIKILLSVQHICNDKINSSPVSSFARRDLAAIVISIYNETAFAELTLKAVSKFTKFPHRVVVVNNSTRDIRPFKRMAFANKIVDYWFDFHSSHGNSLQLAARKLQEYKYLAILDSDAVPIRDNWLNSLIDILNRDNAGVIGPLRQFGNHPQIFLNSVHPCCMVINQGLLCRNYEIYFHSYMPFFDTAGMITWDCKLRNIPVSIVPHKNAGDVRSGISYIDQSVAHCWYASRIFALSDDAELDNVKVGAIRRKTRDAFEMLKKETGIETS